MGEPELKSILSDDPHSICYQQMMAEQESNRRLRRQLQQAQERSAAITAALGEAVHLVAHNLRTSCRRCEKAMPKINAALADTGKGWLPPEVGKQARQALEQAPHDQLCRNNSELTPTARRGAGRCERCAALTALEVK